MDAVARFGPGLIMIGIVLVWWWRELALVQLREDFNEMAKRLTALEEKLSELLADNP